MKDTRRPLEIPLRIPVLKPWFIPLGDGRWRNIRHRWRYDRSRHMPHQSARECERRRLRAGG